MDPDLFSGKSEKRDDQSEDDDRSSDEIPDIYLRRVFEDRIYSDRKLGQRAECPEHQERDCEG